MSLTFVIHSSFDIAVKLSTELLWAYTAVFGVALTVSCSHLGHKCVSVFSIQLLRMVLGVVEVRGSISPLFAGPSFFKHQGDFGWVGAAGRVAMDISSSC